MADNTKIEWTDATVNYVNGCSVVSPGCTNCYAMRLAGTRLRNHPTRAGLTTMSKAGPVWNGQVRANEAALMQPLRWKRPRRIFWNAHGDLFHPDVPDEWIDRQFAVMALTPQHVHQVLTKRSARMRRYMTETGIPNEDRNDRIAVAAFDIRDELSDGKPLLAFTDNQCFIQPDRWPLPNVWLGVSAEDQTRADERREDFRATPAAVKFVSYEPALGPVDWTGWEFVQQIISGGESGPKARPSHPDWYRGARDFCEPHGIAYFHKQNGAWTSGENVDRQRGVVDAAWWVDGQWTFGCENLANEDGHIDDEPHVYRIGKRAAGRLLDGVTHDGMPGGVR